VPSGPARFAPSSSAEAVSHAFAEALSSGDADSAAACFSAEGRLLTPDGTEVRGKASIREVLRQLIVTYPTIEARPGRLVPSAGIALGSQCWRIASRAVGTEPFEQTLEVSLVFRYETGAWSLVIAAPWAGAMGAGRSGLDERPGAAT
jgi:ketosteroid isomerase-like protein